MYNALNFSWGSIGSPQNATVMNSQIAALICPSDGIKTPSQGRTVRNYHANIGGPPNIASWNGAIVSLPTDANGINGLDGYPRWNGNSATFGFASFTDGTSNTVMFSEKLVGSGPIAPVPRNHRNGQARLRLGRHPWPQPRQGQRRRARRRPSSQACKAMPGSRAVEGHRAARRATASTGSAATRAAA